MLAQPIKYFISYPRTIHEIDVLEYIYVLNCVSGVFKDRFIWITNNVKMLGVWLRFVDWRGKLWKREPTKV